MEKPNPYITDSDCFNCDKPLSGCQCGESEGYSSGGAVCPYCGYLNDPGDSDGELYDESVEESECGNCALTFRCSLYVSHAWTTNRLSK